MESTAVAADVLEITAVYGTQAVSIKKEKEPVVSVKEEAHENDTEYGEYYSYDIHDRIQYDLTDVPLVYTTRLDQMNAIHNIKKHTSKEVTEMILAESKPKYNQLSVPMKPESASYFITSYIELCSQIQLLNTKVKTENNLRNEKLIKMCKPLKIVLEDLNVNKRKEPHNKILNSEFEDYSSDEYVPLSYFSDDISASKLTLHEDLTKTKADTMTIAIKDKRSQGADIYILDSNKGVKSYYRTNITECDKIQKLHQSKKAMLLEYCCWVNREKRINQLIRLGCTSANLSVFLRKPHNCLPRPCSCCCVFGTAMPKKSSNSEFANIIEEKSISEINLPVKINNTIIEKAKRYQPKIPSALQGKTVPAKINDKSNYLKKAVIIIKYHRIIFAQTGLLGENYEIGNKGEIVNFVRPTVNRSITEERQLYQMFDTTSGITRTYFSYMVCCWHSREDVIDQQLHALNVLSNNALLFLRSPHLCRNDKCECCCKPEPLINLTLENFSAPKNTYAYSKKQIKIKAPVTDECKKKKNINTNSRIGILNDNKNIKNAEKNYSKIKTYKPKAPQKTNKIFPKPKIIHPISKSALPGDIIKQNSASDILSNSETTPPNTQFVGVSNQPNLSNSIVLNSEKLAHLKTVQTTLANGILNKFKNLKLSVNDKGKLTALINTRQGKLSTVEITIISDILSLAATQINQLGITPQEFCNRVNAKEGNNSLFNPLSSYSDIVKNKPENDTYNDSNLLTTSQVTCIDPQGFKAVPLNSLVPITKNKSSVCNIYQIMSSIGGQKNQHLVQAYESHLKKKMPWKNKERAKNRPKTDMAVLTPLNKKPDTLPARTPVVKRKMETTPIQKKFRVKSPEKLLQEKNPIESASISDKEKNSVPLLVSNSNFIPIQNTSGTTVPRTANDAINYSQTPFYVINNSFIQTENTCSTNVPSTALGVVHNQMPDISNNGNYLQNSNCTIRLDHNQKPYNIFVNGIILSPQNQSDIIVPEPTVRTFHNQTPHFINNSIVTPIGITSDTIVPEPIEDAVCNQTPLFINDSNARQIENVNDTIVLNTALMANNSLAPNLSTSSNFVPIPSTSNGDASTVACVAKSSAESVTNVNPLLHQMLLQKSSLTPRKSSTPLHSATMSVKPLVLAHCNESLIKQKRKKPSILKKAVKRKPNIVNTVNIKNIEIDLSSCDDEMDTENSLKTNFIALSEPTEYTEDEVLRAVNNKQMMIDDEEESIFGV